MPQPDPPPSPAVTEYIERTFPGASLAPLAGDASGRRFHRITLPDASTHILMDYGHAGAWTETLGICAPLQEMMLQSFGGVLRLFPAWPREVAASFTTFRTEGAFLVSASWAEGSVASAEIRSEKGDEQHRAVNADLVQAGEHRRSSVP